MSGHSHWHKIKYKKGTADSKKSQAFSKMVRLITIAAREKGGDPDKNSKLRMVIEKAKEINLPSENIDKAIKRGTGELEGGKLEEFLFEAYGPGKIAIMIEGITDNKNRTLAELKQILDKNKGKLVGSGSVKWLFERKGIITIKTKAEKGENLQMMAIELGAEDLISRDGFLDIVTKPAELEKIKKELEKQGIDPKSASLDWVAKEKKGSTEQNKKAAFELFEELDASEDVQEIYSNLKT